MKSKKHKLLLVLPLILIALFSFRYVLVSDKEQAIDQMLIQSLAALHYSPVEINDGFSEKVFKVYIERLDYNKKFLLQSDVDELKKFNKSIDEDIKDGKFTFFDKSLEIINTRVEEAQTYYKDILAQPFDFSADESVELDAEKLKFSKTKMELKEAWRKSLKYQTLAKVYELKEAQEKLKDNKDSAEFVTIKSVKELEVEARAKVLKSNDDYFKRLKGFNRNDRINIYFNSITGIYDPHTEYYAPKDKATFDIGMSGQLEGIGAQLQEKDGYIKVTNIVPGSASWRDGQLKVNDIILKVAQGDGEPVDVVDMRLDEAVQLIRGKKGTEVRLTIKKPDASTIIISLIRDIVILEDTYAQSVILQSNKRVGYIKLPTFYADFSGNNGGRSCAKDIKKELLKLKEENVDGVILDLRYNGGGSLGDVVDMTGLFIDKGPIVQVKQKTGLPQMYDDRDPAIVYDGPLVVMVNSSSASASEILAAAIQDYKRGVIVGTSPATFGKGTVQRFYDLDEYLPAEYSNVKPIGSVKITTQKFYRVNGGATQLKGVTPDILLPDPYYLIEQGEKEQDYPMAWDEIKPAVYIPWSATYSLDKLKSNSTQRVKSSKGFALLDDAAKRIKKQRDNTIVSLNLEKYEAEQKQNKAEAKKLDELDKEIVGLEVNNLKVDIASIDSDTVKQARNKEWLKNIKKDIYLNETLSIIGEMKK